MNSIIAFLKEQKINILYYIIGFLVLGFAVNIMKASTMGNGAWDTVTINARDYLNQIIGIPWVTMGMVSFTVSFIIMSIIISYRRKIRYLFMLLPMVLVALSIDFWNFVVFYDREASMLVYQIIFFVIGMFLLPLGLTLIVKSYFPAFVFDELMLMFVKITKAKKITYVRLTIEIIGITVGGIFGYLTYYHVDGSFGAVDIGSFILAIVLSPIMTFYFHILKIKKEKPDNIETNNKISKEKTNV
ncbi:MAG: YczE/YyaS/YitT family protein [Bacillota bacterium]